MTAIEDPIEYEITIRSETDHEWLFRRKDANDIPLIPTSAAAHIRSSTTDTLWQILTCTIADDGWISVTLPRIDADYDDWISHGDEGHWDLLVTYAGKIYRWVEGKVINDVGVTHD